MYLSILDFPLRSKKTSDISSIWGWQTKKQKIVVDFIIYLHIKYRLKNINKYIMTTKDIELLFLNIGDILEIVLENFSYKISNEEGKNVVEMEQNKRDEKDWIFCPIITGAYCGCNYKQPSDELNIIKVRVSKPFDMGDAYRNYLEFAPSQLTSITVIEKHKTGVLDKITHALAKEKNETKNQIASHFAFGEHWNELPEYVGYMPTNKNWHMLKSEFYASERYNHENPLPINIQKDGNILVVNLYGFKIPETPMVVALGTDTAIQGRVALCQTISTKNFIAIAW